MPRLLQVTYSSHTTNKQIREITELYRQAIIADHNHKIEERCCGLDMCDKMVRERKLG